MRNSNKNKRNDSIESQPIDTVIGTDIVFKGDIKGQSVIRVDGTIEGNLSLTKGIVIGEKAKINGNLKSDRIIIYGTIFGDIECKELNIRSSGIVNGNIQTSNIEIELGGKYNGNLTMQQTPSQLSAKEKISEK
ncbi:MAG: Polymer-forming cytoskeletal [Bacteroidetes bacterium ADurb.BinA174]|nr:MAG: Polymer-forming cytoskeletal [Bacteroidetes bacterium ADurb.BinA174]